MANSKVTWIIHVMNQMILRSGIVIKYKSVESATKAIIAIKAIPAKDLLY